MSGSRPAAALEVSVLGELAVEVAGELRPLPRSRKVRALLAYLAVSGRPHRRDHLCNLFWDVADDRRAALRWSLTKLRRTLEPEAQARLVATRDHVELTLAPDELDLARLRSLARAGLESQPIEILEAIADLYRGELLEGMLLPDFDAFEAWLEAERAEARALHARIRRALVERLEAEPERAFTHAREWWRRSASDEARAWVERLSQTLGGPRSSASPSDATAREPTSVGGDRSASTLRLPAMSPPPSPAEPLVGRDGEMARLRLIAREARAQHSGRIVLLVGEPGMGKTRILEELRRALRDPSPCALDAAAHEAERHRPLGPFVDALRDALGEGALSSPDAPDREQIFETIASLVRRGADEHGLALLLLDDAHLCDPSSSELLHYVVRTSSRSPLLTVIGARPAELEDNAPLSRALAALRRRQVVDEIRLAPLGEDSLRALIGGATQRAPSADVLRESAGNPLLALELARAGGDRAGAVPRTLSELVLARLESLPSDTRALVRWASVFERGSVAALEAACAGEVAEPLSALETAVRYRLVRSERAPGGSASFAVEHSLIGRIVYESITPVRRAAMHRIAAEVLARDTHAGGGSSVVAHHAARADRADVAAEALVRSAERCAAIGALEEAGVLADRALDMMRALEPASALPLEIDALLVVAQASRPEPLAPFVARLDQLGLRALELGRGESARRAFHGASTLRWEAGTSSEGYYGLARRAWQASRGGDAELRARGASFMAMCLAFMEKDLPDALAMVQEAEALARREGHADPVELALARGLLHFHAGRFEDARRDAEDACTLARVERAAIREAAALELSMQVELATGRLGAVEAAASALVELAARMREGGEGMRAAAALALCRPRLAEARAVLEDALTQLRELDDKRRQAWVANRWARWERREGDRARARSLAAAALEAARAVDAHSEAAIAACELMAAAGDGDETYGHAEEVLAELEAASTLSHEARTWLERA